jgi:hypothetical protein
MDDRYSIELGKRLMEMRGEIKNYDMDESSWRINLDDPDREKEEEE